MTRFTISLLLAPAFGFVALVLGVALCLALESVGAGKVLADALAWMTVGSSWTLAHVAMWNAMAPIEASERK